MYVTFHTLLGMLIGSTFRRVSRALRFQHAASLRMDFIAGEENHPRVVAVIVLDSESTEVLLTIQKRLAGIVTSPQINLWERVFVRLRK